MLEKRRPYYDRFHCLAGACPDSCCKEWDVAVDPETAQRYVNLKTDLGHRLRQVMVLQEDGSAWIQNEKGRCPLWQEDGLCRIQRELGAEALCQVCRDFPRLYHDYGAFVELGLELSCPEAARLIFSAPPEPFLETKVPGGEEAAVSPTLALLLESRERALALLEGSPAQALTALFFYGLQVQDALDFEEETCPLPAPAVVPPLPKKGSFSALRDFFRNLDILTDRWRQLLDTPPLSQPLPEDALALAQYFLDRYWLQALSDGDLMCRVKAVLAACLLLTSLPGDFRANAQLFSKEIENSPENWDAVLDAMYTEPAMTDSALLWLLKNAEGTPEK